MDLDILGIKDSIESDFQFSTSRLSEGREYDALLKFNRENLGNPIVEASGKSKLLSPMTSKEILKIILILKNDLEIEISGDFNEFGKMKMSKYWTIGFSKLINGGSEKTILFNIYNPIIPTITGDRSLIETIFETVLKTNLKRYYSIKNSGHSNMISWINSK